MQRSSSQSSPVTFRGFAICVAGVLAGYLALIASLSWGIQSTLAAAAL